MERGGLLREDMEESYCGGGGGGRAKYSMFYEIVLGLLLSEGLSFGFLAITAGCPLIPFPFEVTVFLVHSFCWVPCFLYVGIVIPTIPVSNQIPTAPACCTYFR